jgi:hypothetical protein
MRMPLRRLISVWFRRADVRVSVCVSGGEPCKLDLRLGQCGGGGHRAAAIAGWTGRYLLQQYIRAWVFYRSTRT